MYNVAKLNNGFTIMLCISITIFISLCSPYLHGCNTYKIVSIGAVFIEIIYYASKAWAIKSYHFGLSITTFISLCLPYLCDRSAYKIVSIRAVFIEIITVYYASKTWAKKSYHVDFLLQFLYRYVHLIYAVVTHVKLSHSEQYLLR